MIEETHRRAKPAKIIRVSFFFRTPVTHRALKVLAHRVVCQQSSWFPLPVVRCPCEPPGFNQDFKILRSIFSESLEKQTNKLTKIYFSFQRHHANFYLLFLFFDLLSLTLPAIHPATFPLVPACVYVRVSAAGAACACTHLPILEAEHNLSRRVQTHVTAGLPVSTQDPGQV